jgi:hypothetical protein
VTGRRRTFQQCGGLIRGDWSESKDVRRGEEGRFIHVRCRGGCSGSWLLWLCGRGVRGFFSGTTSDLTAVFSASTLVSPFFAPLATLTTTVLAAAARTSGQPLLWLGGYLAPLFRRRRVPSLSSASPR